MAYYPSPDPSPATTTAPELPSPRASSSSASATTPTPQSSNTSNLSSAPVLALEDPPKHKRLTAKTPARLAEEKAAEEKEAESKGKATVEKIGNKDEVVVVGKRIRCKMCR
jgi:dual specificity phosphatase 12